MVATKEDRRKITLRHGTFAKVARRFKNRRTKKPLSLQHVREVWLGNRPGDRILAALWREYEKQQSDQASPAPTASAA